MTVAEFRAALRDLELTPAQRTYDGGSVYVDRAGMFVNVPDPHTMTERQRAAMIELYRTICN